MSIRLLRAENKSVTQVAFSPVREILFRNGISTTELSAVEGISTAVRRIHADDSTEYSALDEDSPATYVESIRLDGNIEDEVRQYMSLVDGMGSSVLTRKSGARRMRPPVISNELVGRFSAIKNTLLNSDGLAATDYGFSNYSSINCYTVDLSWIPEEDPEDAYQPFNDSGEYESLPPRSNFAGLRMAAQANESAILWPTARLEDEEYVNRVVPSAEGDCTIELWIKPGTYDANYEIGGIISKTGDYGWNLSLVPFYFDPDGVTGERANSAFDDLGRPKIWHLLWQGSSGAAGVVADPATSISFAGAATPGSLTGGSSSPRPSSGAEVSGACMTEAILKTNHWHHVAFRYNSLSYECDLIVDGTPAATWESTSPPIAFPVATDKTAIVVGNVWTANSSSDYSWQFFNDSAAETYGIQPYGNDEQDPLGQFSFPLNAELHEIRIWNRWIPYEKLYKNAERSVAALNDPNLVFYVPVTFVPQGNLRQNLISPFNSVARKENAPVNTDLSYALGGLSVNIENWLIDRSSEQLCYPRLINLCEDILLDSTEPASADAFLQSILWKRNSTILPNDNGQHVPNFTVLLQQWSGHPLLSKEGAIDLSFVSARNWASRLLPNLSAENAHIEVRDDEGNITLYTPDWQQFIDSSPVWSAGVEDDSLVYLDRPEDPRGVLATFRPTYTVLQRTGDPDSREIVAWNISSIFYGEAIQSVEIEENGFEIGFWNEMVDLDAYDLYDDAFSPLNMRKTITLRKQTNGGIGRCNCVTKPSTWNTVGNLYASDGIVDCLFPSLSRMGLNSTIRLTGLSKRSVLEVLVGIPAGDLRSSQNPNFKKMKVSNGPNEVVSEHVRITQGYLHDQDLAILAKASYVHPILKRPYDSIGFRYKFIV